MSNPFLDYYGDKKIIPVRQDISDLAHHFERREALFRHLGLLPAVFQGKRIIEFGPGSGDDAVHTASYRPTLYTLVDGNPASIRALEQKQAEGSLPRSFLNIVPSDILSFTDDRPYDVVLSEGTVPGQKDSASFLRHIASFADKGGIVMCTTHSATSLLAETCRRMLKPILAPRFPDFEDLKKALIEICDSHLATLPGMNRLREDWVLDTILHPWRKEVLFSMEEAIRALDSDFDVIGTSPRFFQDWRWYKSIPRHEKRVNQMVIEDYHRWNALFLDYRLYPEKVGLPVVEDLEARCRKIFLTHLDIWDQDDPEQVHLFLDDLKPITEMLRPALPGTARSLDCYIQAINLLISGAEISVDFKDFKSWFGRGQQYVSFLKRTHPTG